MINIQKLQGFSRIRRVAVLGAGVMGAQIAALFVNAKIPVILFDLPAKEGNKNQIPKNAIANLLKLKPAPLLLNKLSEQIVPANYDEHLPLLKECDLVIEAISENLELKVQLFQRISPYLSATTILATNSSGLSINRLAQTVANELQSRFLGIHFFNPPRYMNLVELIPNEKTDAALLNYLEAFLVSELGKGVVRAKDTPNFIANRIGVFALLATLKYQTQFQLDYATVDALTGVLIGRPKSATFRTIDVVGLDTMAHVVATLHQECQSDPWYDYFTLPVDYQDLIAAGSLGQKTRKGFYQKKGPDILVYQPQSKDYQITKPVISNEIKTIFQNGFQPELLLTLAKSNDPQAQFLWHMFSDILQYCAYHLPAIAHHPDDIDKAMRLGFGWEWGPFEIWQKAGVSTLFSQMQQMPVKINQSQIDVFTKQSNESAPSYFQQPKINFTKTIYDDNEILVQLTDQEIAVMQLRSKNQVITEKVIQGIQQAVPIAEQSARGLVLWQESDENFCFGANLKLFDGLLASGKQALIEEIVHQFQISMRALKYATIPVVAGLRGRALGGGCEILLHCDSVVAAFESYVGLVEIGVGLLPAGGGLLHGAKRAAKKAEGRVPFQELFSYYMQIAQGKVANSALEAIEFGYLPEDTTLVANTHDVLFHAVQKARFLADSNYRPELPSQFSVGGRTAKAAMQSQVVNYFMGDFITQDDMDTAVAIAEVICGGDVDAGTLVDEEWFYRIEREAFAKLANRPVTHQRIRERLHIN